VSSVGVTLTLASSTFEIANALGATVNTFMYGSEIECGSFSVTKDALTSTVNGVQTTALFLNVTFECDRMIPYSLLAVDTSFLTGSTYLLLMD
jgi:hypothetical protein